MNITKSYLSSEQERNKRAAELFTKIVKRAFGDCEVLIGHHIGFEPDHDFQREDEIPSADSLIFDHGIMQAVFGDYYKTALISLALEPTETRDQLLAQLFREYVTSKEVSRLQRATVLTASDL